MTTIRCVEVWFVYSNIEEAKKHTPDNDVEDYEYKGFSIEKFELDNFVN